MEIYLATGNKNKKKEMQEIFPAHTIVTPEDRGIEFSPDETGATFYENSLIKARALWEVVHCPVLADDSGICVDALGGAPGIYSSRYAGPDFMRGLGDGKKIPQEKQNYLLISQLNSAIANMTEAEIDVKKKSGLFLNGPRSAHYTCAMVLYLGKDRLFVAEETMEGLLVDRIEDARGDGGFGYDPLFIVPEYGKTAAEITSEQKNTISHRGKAARVIKAVADEVLR